MSLCKGMRGVYLALPIQNYVTVTKQKNWHKKYSRSSSGPFGGIRPSMTSMVMCIQYVTLHGQSIFAVISISLLSGWQRPALTVDFHHLDIRHAWYTIKPCSVCYRVLVLYSFNLTIDKVLSIYKVWHIVKNTEKQL